MTYEDHHAKLKNFTSPSGKIAYIDEGEGPVLLLLHGVPTSSWLYRKMIPILANAGHRVIAPDMLGYGASDKPDDYLIYDDDNMASILIALMDHLQIETWQHLFHDGGGIWTWAMLKLHPRRVKRLFMLNTLVYQEGFKPPIKFDPGWLARLYTRQYTTRLGRHLMVKGTLKNGIENDKVINKNMLRGYKQPFVRGRYHGLYYFFTQTCQKMEDYQDLHRSLDIPLTVIWGKYDKMLVWSKIAEKVKENFDITDDDVNLEEGNHLAPNDMY